MKIYGIFFVDWQLSQVNQALQVCTNDTERASLENLKCDLEEILNLTRETLNELKGPSNNGSGGDEENADEDDDDDPYAQEMAIFLAEINDCDGGNGSGSCSGSTSKSTVPNPIATDDAARISPPMAEVEKFKVNRSEVVTPIQYIMMMNFVFCFLYFVRVNWIRLLGKSVLLHIHLRGEHEAIIMH